MDHGFTHRLLPSGEVAIDRAGKTVTTLRGAAATAFLARISDATFEERQQTMARATGNYRRGNERNAARHPRNL